GGDLNRLNADERSMVAFFKSYIKKNPHLKNHFHHLAALPNEEIRRLEKEIIKKTFYYPHIYLCSSKKEEFGLAILEALAQTFLVIGPIKGGVKSYLENGKNGFLIDTTNSKTIASETESILAYLKDHQEEVATIRKAGKKTVFDQFSLRKIAVDFLSTYRAIL
ncbi:MAG: glycosyltransferase, partial [Pisciglobus halotolerans]|nr:glycosyltransferase [Pisciglobus halotolerans]